MSCGSVSWMHWRVTCNSSTVVVHEGLGMRLMMYL